MSDSVDQISLLTLILLDAWTIALVCIFIPLYICIPINMRVLTYAPAMLLSSNAFYMHKYVGLVINKKLDSVHARRSSYLMILFICFNFIIIVPSMITLTKFTVASMSMLWLPQVMTNLTNF